MTARTPGGAVLVLLLALLLALPGTAARAGEARVLKQPPQEGTIHPGERVLVNDGSCPRGQIREIVGGANRSLSSTGDRRGGKRTDRCIPR